MKAFFLACILLFVVAIPVYGQPLSDSTGFVNRLDVQSGGHNFEVKLVSNFHVSDFDFSNDEKRLTLFISSSLENNLGDLVLPQNLLGGNLTFYLNGEKYMPITRTTQTISFVTLNFTGSGDNSLEIFGTSSLVDSDDKENPMEQKPQSLQDETDSDNPSYLLIVIGVLIVIVVVFLVMKIKRRK